MGTHFLLTDGSASDRPIENFLAFTEAAAPATPATGFGRLYEKTDGKLYFKNDAGTEFDLTGGGGDDLGNHTATQDLDMSENDIINAKTIHSGADGSTPNIDLTTSSIINTVDNFFQVDIGASNRLSISSTSYAVDAGTSGAFTVDIGSGGTKMVIDNDVVEIGGTTSGSDVDIKLRHDLSFNVGGTGGTKTLERQFAWEDDSAPVELPTENKDGDKRPIIAYFKQPSQSSPEIDGGWFASEATNPIDSSYTTPSNHRTTYIDEGWVAYGHSARTTGRGSLWINSYDDATGSQSSELFFGRGKPSLTETGTSSIGTTHWAIESRYSFRDSGSHDDMSRLQIFETPGNPDHENNTNDVFRSRMVIMPNTGWIGICQAGDDPAPGARAGSATVTEPLAPLHIKTDVGSDRGGVSGFNEVVAIFENDTPNGDYSSYNFNQTRWPGAPTGSSTMAAAISIVARHDKDSIIYLAKRTSNPTSKIEASAWDWNRTWNIRNDANGGDGDEFQIRGASGPKSFIKITTAEQVYLSAPNAAPATTMNHNPWVNFSLDESNDNLRITAKYSNGTVKTGTVALT